MPGSLVFQVRRKDVSSVKEQDCQGCSATCSVLGHNQPPQAKQWGQSPGIISLFAFPLRCFLVSVSRGVCPSLSFVCMKQLA